MRLVLSESPGFSRRGLELFHAAGWEVVAHEGPPGAVAATVVRRGAEGLICRFGVRWTAERLAELPGLRFLAIAATGTDHVDRAAAAQRRIEVISLAGHPGLDAVTATPEHALGLMLALLRGTVGAHAAVLAGRWDRRPHVGRQVRGLPIGLVGLGRTGRALAEAVSAMGAKVSYVDPVVEDTRWPRLPSVQALAAQATVISVHATLTPGTSGLLDRAFFAALAPGSYLINTARGGLVDEDALVEALRSGRLAGAALDVLASEPATGAPLTSPLLDLARAGANVILTPHIGGATHESLEHAEALLAQVLLDRYGPSSGPPHD